MSAVVGRDKITHRLPDRQAASCQNALLGTQLLLQKVGCECNSQHPGQIQVLSRCHCRIPPTAQLGPRRQHRFRRHRYPHPLHGLQVFATSALLLRSGRPLMHCHRRCLCVAVLLPVLLPSPLPRLPPASSARCSPWAAEAPPSVAALPAVYDKPFVPFEHQSSRCHKEVIEACQCCAFCSSGPSHTSAAI